MIIVICDDDPRVMELAQHSARRNPALGRVVHYSQPEALAQGEDLFIIGHGVLKGAGGNPAIGDLNANGLSVNAVELNEYLGRAGVYANWTKGRVFILACESLAYNPDAFSFAEVFYAQVAPNREVKVFGRHDNTIGEIPAPGDKDYVQVVF